MELSNNDISFKLNSLSHWVGWIDKQKDSVYNDNSLDSGSFQSIYSSQIEIHAVVDSGIQF